MRLVILDRDNTLIRLPPGRRYLYGADEISLAAGAVALLRRLREAGMSVAVATNQQGVALPEYPDMTIASVNQFHERLMDELGRQHASIDRFYVCPHSAESLCGCRKPRPGLFVQAMKDFGVFPHETAAIGDQWRDAQAAHAAGIRALFLVGSDQARSPQPPELTDVRMIASLDACVEELLAV